ncbi:MAG: CCA tRNA nucleotidyltransferase, partial [Acidobacteriota bacterium]
MARFTRIEPSLLEGALGIVRTLRKHRFEALFAGGAVRDMLLDQDTSDIDVATSARPEDLESIFEHTVPVGKQFGVMIVVLGGHSYEVATFRRDTAYSDGRHPVGVEFTDAEEDARRRDFTVNGLFYDPIAGEVIDYVGGRA